MVFQGLLIIAFSNWKEKEIAGGTKKGDKSSLCAETKVFTRHTG